MERDVRGALSGKSPGSSIRSSLVKAGGLVAAFVAAAACSGNASHRQSTADDTGGSPACDDPELGAVPGCSGDATSPALTPRAEGVSTAPTCSQGSTPLGIDVSAFQGEVDWVQVKSSGRAFAFARVSDGTRVPDTRFAANWSAIPAAGLVRGVYQFFRASQDPTAQANLLISAIGSLQPEDLPPVADVEVSDGVPAATLVENLATWVSVIQQATGRTPIIYTMFGFWNGLPNTGQFAAETLWVAEWGVSCPTLPATWNAWSVWQSNDAGQVPGIAGNVDLDQFNGPLASLQSQAAVPGPMPTPETADGGNSPFVADGGVDSEDDGGFDSGSADGGS
jgi:lysozyme